MSGSRGDIRFGLMDGSPFFYLVVGETNDGDELYLQLTEYFDIRVGEAFGTEYGVESGDIISNANDDCVATDTFAIACIDEEEVDRILKAGGFTIPESDGDEEDEDEEDYEEEDEDKE